MPARGSKSKRGSGANSASEKQHKSTFFVDKCLGTHIVPDALRAQGLSVEIKTDHFPQDAKDTEWLPEVGRRGWVILSKDKHLRHNYLEIISILQSQAVAFLLTSGNFTGEEMAGAFLQAMPDIRKMLEKYSPPFIATVSKTGRVRMKYTIENLIDKVGATRDRR